MTDSSKPKPHKAPSRSPRLHQSLTGQGIDGNQDPICDTTVCHTPASKASSNRYPIRLSDDPGCSTAVCHNGPAPTERLPQPSRRPQAPSHPRSKRQPSGLIVRGRVFYLRLRVPGGLVEKVGRTHWVRSLGTGYRREAVRRAEVKRIVLDALREATGPVTTAHAAERVMAGRGLPASDPELRDLFGCRVGACLRKLELKGVTQQVDLPGRFNGWQIARR